MKSIIGLVLLLAVVVGAGVIAERIYYKSLSPPRLETPSPALGRAVATAAHQALTDPYLKPLERLAAYIAENPDAPEVSLQQLTEWCVDAEMPVCFVWDLESGFQFARPASPWALEEVLGRLRASVATDNPKGLLFVDTFVAEGQKYWLGFLRLPVEGKPRQMAGVFFSIDRYLERDVPRFLNEMVTRRRFPLVAFQLNDPPRHGEPDGDIAIRIIDQRGEVYYQHGREFSPEKMIYSESKYYPKPIVCLQEGWDLQVFSSNAPGEDNWERSRRQARQTWMAAAALAGVIYAWGVWSGRKRRLRDEP